MTRQTHAAHHVDLEDFLPVCIADVEERLNGIDAQVVDQNVGLWLGIDQCLATNGGAQIGDHAACLCTGLSAPQLGQCRLDAVLLAAADDHGSTGIRQPLGNSQANTAGGARNDSGLAGKVDDHRKILLVKLHANSIV
ncbi:hypothetical protein D3C77_514290 [compost metagenome]